MKFKELLGEARKPQFFDSLFGGKVCYAYYIGALTAFNIPKFNRFMNGGIDPDPPFNTWEIYDYFMSLSKSKQKEKIERVSANPDVTKDVEKFAKSIGMNI